VVIHSVIGVKVHDAKLVAAMVVHGITHLLTLDEHDFARYPPALQPFTHARSRHHECQTSLTKFGVVHFFLAYVWAIVDWVSCYCKNRRAFAAETPLSI
jgi:hypothetical protein